MIVNSSFFCGHLLEQNIGLSARQATKSRLETVPK
jgi:hypothetical protein